VKVASGPLPNHIITELITFAPARKANNPKIQIAIPFKVTHTSTLLTAYLIN
jgi:hypothetical protein